MSEAFCKHCQSDKSKAEMHTSTRCQECVRIKWRELAKRKRSGEAQSGTPGRVDNGPRDRLAYDRSNPMAAKAVAVTRLIRRQVFPSPAANMMFAVFAQAVEDSVPINRQVTWEETIDARKYLQGDLYHLEMAGIEVEWARKLLREQGLLNWNQERAA